MDINEFCTITFKFGGYWTIAQRESRLRYEGGSQKTAKLYRNKINFLSLKEKVEIICPWIVGQAYELHYHIKNTSPKVYMAIVGDTDVLDMLNIHDDGSKVEVVVAMQSIEEVGIQTENVEQVNGNQNVVLFNSTQENNVVVDELSDGFLSCNPEDINSLHVGLTFKDSTSFKNALRSVAILQNFAIKIKASDKSRVIAICDYRGCPCRIRASVCSDGHTFEIRKVEGTHLCPGVNRAENKQATSSWIAHQIIDVVKKNPDFTDKHIGDTLETNFGLSVPYMKIWHSREEARDLIFGGVDESYRLVPALRSELLMRNSGSHVTYTCDPCDGSFQRFFVSFKVCTDGFLAGCRHLIGVDAYHLKSKYLGVLLAATSLDGNNGLFTLAFAIAESESKSSWEWFMQNLSEALNYELEYLSFISDIEKGLGEAIRNTFPNAEHRVCMRHLWKNMKKLFRCVDSKRLKSLVWTVANEFCVDEFNIKLEEIFNISLEVHSYLTNLPYKWSKSTFYPEIKNHYNTNNVSESFNAWIDDCRNKSAVDLVDMIRRMVMEQRAQRKANSNTWKGPLIPHIEKYIREITTRKVHFIVRQGASERHQVDLDKKKCTCGFWQLTGLPCIHVVAFVGISPHNLWHTYVDELYSVHSYKMAYDGAISTLPSNHHWKSMFADIQVEVPKSLQPRGRLKKRRLRSFLEDQNTIRNMHKCSHCGLRGHHKSTC